MIGADPHTEWLDGAVDRDERGFILTGNDVDRDGGEASTWPLQRTPALLETSAAMGEGATVVQLVHQHLAGDRDPALVAAAAGGHR